MQQQAFMHNMSTKKWLNALCNNDLFSVFYVVSPTKRIKVLMQPQLLDPNMTVEISYLLGHSSNDTNICHPEYTTTDVTQNFISHIETSPSLSPRDSRWVYPSRKQIWSTSTSLTSKHS
jgi:hypothetical protein